MASQVFSGDRLPRGLVVPVALVLIAELAWVVSGTTSDSLAAPSAILLRMLGALADGSMLVATGETLRAAFGGLAIGVSIGLSLGLLRGTFGPVDELLDVTVEALRPIPSSALIPVTILIFGFGYGLEMTCVAISCTWTMLVLSRAAVIAVEPQLIEVGRVLRLGFLPRMTKIVLPAALPRIFVAFRLCTGLSLIVAVTTEITANPLGLGYQMMVAQQSLQPDLTIAYLVWIGFIGWGLNQLLVTAQRRLFGRVAMVGGNP